MQTSKENEKTQKKILNTPITKISGILMFIGAVQWFLVILLAEGLHPGYNSAIHYVSSLGVGKTALFYNTSVILLGLTTIVGTYLMHGSHSSRAFTLLLVLTGLAPIGARAIFSGVLFNPYLGLPRESSAMFLGLSKGTMERLVIYPILLWIIGFGSSLTASVLRRLKE